MRYENKYSSAEIKTLHIIDATSMITLSLVHLFAMGDNDAKWDDLSRHYFIVYFY